MSKLGRTIKSATGGGFFKATATLASSTVLAQGITGLSLLVLSRLYTPADFGLLGTFNALVAVLSVSAAWRLDVAIALPEDDREAHQLAQLAACAALTTCLGLSLLLFTGAHLWGTTAFMARLPFAPALVAVATWISAIYLILQSTAIRQKNFATLGQAKVIQTAATAGTQLGLGWMTHHGIGLVLGAPLGLTLSAINLLRQAIKRHRSMPSPWLDRAAIVKLLRRYSHYPKYSTVEALANTAGMQLPLMLLYAHSSASDAGHVTLALTVMQAPMALIGSSVAQVFLAYAPGKHRDGQLPEFTGQVIRRLFMIGAPVLLVIGIAAPFFATTVFGPSWARTGALIAWMTPGFLLQFLSAPVSMGLHVIGRQRLNMQLQIIGLVLRLGLVAIACNWSPTWGAEVYAATGALVYGLYLFTIGHSVGLRWSDLSGRGPGAVHS